MRNIFGILRKPIVTEKSTESNETQKKATFQVDIQANKTEIKKAVEELFGVSVIKVNTSRYKGKPKRFRMRMGKRRDWKKAVVTLSEGDRIDFFEGMR